MLVAHRVDAVHIGHEDTEDLELRGGYSGEGKEDVKSLLNGMSPRVVSVQLMTVLITTFPKTVTGSS